MHEKQHGSIIIENMSMPQKGKVKVLVLRDDGRCIDEFGNVYKVVPANRTDREPMYKELIKELRKESCGAKSTSWWRAADAIEFLQTYKVALENIISMGGWWLVGQDKNLHRMNVPMNWPPKGTKTVKLFRLPQPPKEETE